MLDVAERDDRERRDRGQDRDHGRDPEQVADRGRRPERLLGRELDDLGHRLQQPERTDAVRAVASLEAAEELALVDDHDRQNREDTPKMTSDLTICTHQGSE